MTETATDTDAICDRISAMWLRLGEQIKGALPDIVIDNKPEEAVRWATLAEACFWQSTGEASSHEVKDVLPAGRAALQSTERE